MTDFTLIGRKVRFAHTLSDGGTLIFSAKVIKLSQRHPGAVWVEIPTRVSAIKFPPFNGKRHVLCLADKLTFVS